MQLPDEAISYQYQTLLVPPVEEWNPLAEVRSKHLLSPARLKGIAQQLMQIRSQVATERELQNPPPEMKPLQAGFIDLPQKHLDNHRRKGETSELGRILKMAGRLKELADRVIIVSIGGLYLGARALFDGLVHTYHNELPAKSRMGVPRIYFEGNNVDNDSLQDLLELLENSCVDSDIRDERYGLIVISHSGATLETAVAFRILRNEAVKYYGASSEILKEVIVPVTGSTGKLHDLCNALGYTEDEVLNIPDNVGDRYSVFTPAGLLPAAVMGLDVRALLLGASAMTRRFLEEPFERNPVLQYAAVNHLMSEEAGKPIRVLAVWSKKLESLGLWYDQLVAESLGKQGRGPTPLTMVGTRDLHARGQQHQEGPRDKIINNLLVKTPRTPPLVIGMGEHNQDDLNYLNRKGYPDFMNAAQRGTSQAYLDAGRPTADIVLPGLSEHTMGQLMQMLMLATVVEGRLMGINPYGQPGVEEYKRHMQRNLRS
jgi:glucose-6-phosphate isomerase